MMPCRTFAIVPAAGHSRRMGQAKLLLPWAVGTVIDSVLQAWTTSSVDRTYIVVRAADQVDIITQSIKLSFDLGSPSTGLFSVFLAGFTIFITSVRFVTILVST